MQTKHPTIAIIDTTFALIDMGSIVADEIASSPRSSELNVTRRVVPGFKDLAAAARRAIDDGADLVVACAMPGPEAIDESCAKDASFGLQMVQALTGVSVLEVFVHMSEALIQGEQIDQKKLSTICQRRCAGHANNAVWMTIEPQTMMNRAGTGRRQGADDVGAVRA